MSRLINNWIKSWKRALRKLEMRNRLHSRPPLENGKALDRVSLLRKVRERGVYKRHKWINQCLLLLFTIAIVSACTSPPTNQNPSINSQTAAPDCRLVQHEIGEACIPLVPQRVVVLGSGLDTVLSLGVKPVGSTKVGMEEHYYEHYYPECKVADVANVGVPGMPDLEAIAALQPDLILGTMWNRERYELLSQIAPTVLYELRPGDSWKKLLNNYAEALGKTGKAEQILTDYYARIEEFQTQMGDRLQQTEVSIVGVSPDGISIYLEDSSSGAVVADAGLPRPSHQATIEGQGVISPKISKELIHQADGDVIFIWAGGVNEQEAQTALKELTAAPLWSELNAVQQGNVYEVSAYWYGIGPNVANLILDDLFKYLVDSPS